MKFSILTPSFNSEKFIEETIQSVITQRGNFDLQYIVIDGGSTDDTCNIVNDFITKHQNNQLKVYCKSLSIQLISEPDNGMYDALAKGFKLVDGDWIGYINSDDFYLPNAFKSIQIVHDNFKKINWLTAKNTWYNKHGFICGSQLPLTYKKEYILNGVYGNELPFIQQESTFWKKELLDILNLKEFASYQLAGDFYLWYCFAQKSMPFIINTNISGFRIHEANQSLEIEKYRVEMENIIGGKRKKLSLRDKFYILKYKFITKYFSEKLILKHNKKTFNFWNTSLKTFPITKGEL